MRDLFMDLPPCLVVQQDGVSILFHLSRAVGCLYAVYFVGIVVLEGIGVAKTIPTDATKAKMMTTLSKSIVVFQMYWVR